MVALSKSWPLAKLNMRALALAPLLAVLLTSSAAGEPKRIPGLLFASGEVVVERGPAPIDPALPRGHRMTATPRPTTERTLCSPRHPVCVHGEKTGVSLLLALERLELAYERIVYVLDLPAPLLDADLGGSPALDLYLTHAPSTETGGVTPGTVTHLDLALAEEDSASAFCTHGGSDVSLQDATRCVAEAIAARLDAAESPSVRAAYAADLASWAVGPDLPFVEAIDDVQSNPQLAVVKRDRDALSLGGGLWFSFLDEAVGMAERGRIATTMLSLSRTTTRDLHPEWHNEPDTFDVLRHSLPGGRAQEAEVLAEWGHYRLFVGERSSDSQGLPWLGYFGRSVFDWTLKYSSLPRKVASSRALEPLGMAAVWLELDQVPLGAHLGVQIDWEEPVRFCWVVVGVDEAGKEVIRWDLPFLQSDNHQEKTLMNFESAAGLIFIGINLGGVDASHPFDPDAEPWEPHGFTLYLADLQ